MFGNNLATGDQSQGVVEGWTRAQLGGVGGQLGRRRPGVTHGNSTDAIELIGNPFNRLTDPTVQV